MIDAKELMRGNWLQEEVLGYVKVVSISDKLITVVLKHMDINKEVTDKEISLPIRELHPIPLTPEILQRIDGGENEGGGIENRYTINLDDDGFKLRFSFFKSTIGKEWNEFKIIGNGCYDESGEKDITQICKYIHQLQNLYYSLTNTEIIFKL